MTNGNLVFQKSYPTAEDFLADYDITLRLGGVLVETESEVGLRELATIEILVSGRFVTAIQAETVYAVPYKGGQQMGVEFRGDWEELLEQARGGLDSPQERWGKDSESLYHEIAKMNPHEKIQAALKGGKEERRILLKDSHCAVHPYVLKNPRIGIDEVAHIAGTPTVTGDIIAMISGNTEWMNNAMVRRAIVKNPKTPTNVVSKYVSSLSDQELSQIIRSEHVRDTTKSTARRVLASRGKSLKR